MTSADVYLHGTTPDEHTRLALMNRLLNGPNLEQLGLIGGEEVLELGAGTGVFATELAAAVGPRGRVVGVERDEAQHAEASRNARAFAERGDVARIEIRLGDAYDPPLDDDEWGSFDLVHTRFLLEHLSRPVDVVRTAVRAARPGGRIALLDDDHDLLRLWPEPMGFHDLWRAYQRQFEHLGQDPAIGRKLAWLLKQAGAEPVRSSWIPFGACAGEESFRGVVENMAGVVAGARERIATEDDWSLARIDETLATFRAWGERDDAYLGYPLPCVIGVRPR